MTFLTTLRWSRMGGCSPLAPVLQTTGEDPVDPSRVVFPALRATVDHRAEAGRQLPKEPHEP